jgi:1-acyl-sn-glycerol-3-phosphate acyltransferase
MSEASSNIVNSCKSRLTGSISHYEFAAFFEYSTGTYYIFVLIYEAFSPLYTDLYSIYAFVVFLLLMFLLFPFIVLASFFGRVRGGNIIYIIVRFWADACMLLWGIRHKNIFEAPHDPDHPCIFIFNHISYMDIPVLLCAFRYKRSGY